MLYTADTLSRAPSFPAEEEDDIEAFLLSVTIPSLPASTDRLDAYRKAQEEDPVCRLVIEYCKTGWPRKESTDQNLRSYWKVRGNLSICDDLLLFNDRIVVPKKQQKETLDKIHEGHQGMERCQMRARSAVWWPGISHQLIQKVRHCRVCSKMAKPAKEPLLVTSLPDYPWQKVGTDLFELKGIHYLLTVDYFSRYPEVTKLSSTTSSAIISSLKAVFSRHGIPEVVCSDNGPQFSSYEFAMFSESYGFKHVTSSPRFPQSNGQVERAVQTVKSLLIKSTDPFMALLSYRSTPLPWCDLSPAELSVGRKIRSTVPQTNNYLIPEWKFLADFREKNQKFKTKQKENFNIKHRVQNVPRIADDTEVWVNTDEGSVRGRVVMASEAPRSYIVETPNGNVRRNRSQLNVVPTTAKEDPPMNSTTSSTECSESSSRITTRSMTETPLHPPDYLRF